MDKRIDGLQSEMEHKFDNLHKSISSLVDQHVHQEEECLSDTMVEEQCLQQLQKGLVENFESSDIGVAVCPWEKKEAISPLTEEVVEEHQEYNLPILTQSTYYLHLHHNPNPKHLPQRPPHLHCLCCTTLEN